ALAAPDAPAPSPHTPLFRSEPAEPDRHEGVEVAHAPDQQNQRGEHTDRAGDRELALQVRDRGPPPGYERSDASEREQGEAQRNDYGVEPRSQHRVFHPHDRLREYRE